MQRGFVRHIVGKDGGILFRKRSVTIRWEWEVDGAKVGDCRGLIAQLALSLREHGRNHCITGVHTNEWWRDESKVRWHGPMIGGPSPK